MVSHLPGIRPSHGRQDALEECDVLIHAVPVQSSRKARPGATATKFKHFELGELDHITVGGLEHLVWGEDG